MTKEELQLRWDEILLQARFFHMDMPISAIAVHFMQTYGKYPNDFDLLRCPRPQANGYFVDFTVLRFICGYLPKIADYCWKHTSKDWLKVVDVVNRSTHDTRSVMVDKATKTRDLADLRNATMQVKRRKAETLAFHEKCESYKRSNQWAVCK